MKMRSMEQMFCYWWFPFQEETTLYGQVCYEIAICYGLNVCAPPPNSYVEPLTLKVMVFGGGAFEQ